METPFDPNGAAGSGQEPNSALAKQRQDPEPTPAQITRAVAFLREALKNGPRLTRDVEREARELGHAKRTLDRARGQLHVKKLPPAEFRGPWRIALKDDPAVAEANQRKEAKKQQARERQGNGRKRRKRNGKRSQRSDELLAPLP